MDIKTIIDNIGSVLLYFIPGYITIKTYNLISGRESKDLSSNLNLVYYIVLSYFLTETITLIIPRNISPTAIYCIIVSAIGATISCLFALTLKRKIIKKVFNWLTLRTIEKTVWKANIDFSSDHCPNVVVCTENRQYSGRLIQFGDFPDDGWIVMDLCSISVTQNPTVPIIKEGTEYERVLIPVSEIKNVRVQYAKGDEHYPDWWEDYRKEQEHNQLEK